jgi:hypothetical protein
VEQIKTAEGKKLGRGTNKDFTENKILIHGTNHDYKGGTKT